ncbi:hypothetical protein LEP1GSC058_3860 [Leptospira fainei serovar Hurstbridge str. BUT 6]|uniref:Uncharacterized protein n=1 Tax=Leptospira fainei serovar Hurstbridge str. BUT 6 TaxID=1193011 RepID=S3VAU5_9LEPT|nr:hypothetical protein LEP1GSC058_3860 [Leptospira fainei serovar Hurstbridge str. BUT 6]
MFFFEWNLSESQLDYVSYGFLRGFFLLPTKFYREKSHIPV